MVNLSNTSREHIFSADLVFNITVDNDYKLYFDGVEQYNLSNHADWGTLDSVTLPRNTSVIAIEGINFGGVPAPSCGNPAGIIASSTGGFLRTDSRWKCSATLFDSWSSVGFDDSKWSAASVIGPHGIGPWHDIPGMSPGAFWIWDGNPILGPSTYCRRNLNY